MNHYSSLKDFQAQLFSKNTSCEETTASFIQRIKENQHLNAFLEVFEESALEKARYLDQKLANGEKPGKLFGMVIALKDNICYEDHAISASSKILDSYISPYSSTAVERMLAEDAIIIGRTNCDEFAMGSSNENSAFGNVLNADDTTRVPGGSSGGSAVAVQAGLCHASFGTDTGGSIRQPASFCNVVGFKPTYGRVSRYGLIAYASSFDQLGPFTNSIEDTAILLEVIAGKDDFDSTLDPRPVESYSMLNKENGPHKIAYFKEFIQHDGIEPEVKQASLDFIENLRSNGHTVEEISFPYLDKLIPTYYVITTAEASSNLSRYDGIRYGHRSDKAKSIDEVYTLSRSEGFGKEVKNRIMLGTFVLSAGYYDAYFTKAQKVRRVLKNETNAIFNKYDFIINPTSPSVAFKIGEKANNPISLYLCDIFTVLSNLVGSTSVSLPLYKDQNGLGIGMHIMANSFEEQKLLDFSYSLQESYNFNDENKK